MLKRHRSGFACATEHSFPSPRSILLPYLPPAAFLGGLCVPHAVVAYDVFNGAMVCR